MKIGIQLYTVRGFGHDRDELKSTLGKIRECGYTCVENAGFFGLPVGEFAELAKQYDLEVISTHTGFDSLARDFDNTVAAHKTLGAKNVSVPGIPGSYYPWTVAGFTAFGEAMNNYAKKLAEKNTVLLGCERTKAILPETLLATEEDYATEFLDYKL